MNGRFFIALLFLSIQFIGLQGQFNVEDFGKLNQQQGLSSEVITCMLKDSRGFMWFGTQDGLNRYNGYAFTSYRSNDTVPGALSGNFILSLCEDDRGNIWVGTEDNGLNCYNRQLDRFEVFRSNAAQSNSLPSNSILDAELTPDGTLLFGTGRGVVAYQHEKKEFIPLEFSGTDTLIHTLTVHDLFVDNDGSIWLGTSMGLYRYHPSSAEVEPYLHDPNDKYSISNNVINTIYRSSSGNLYVGTNRGLNVFNPDMGSFSRFYYDEHDPFSEAKSEIQSIAEDDRGNLWLGSFGGGLIKINDLTDQAAVFIHNPDDAGSISNDYVYSLLYDPAGILWVGTYGGGINKIDLVRIRFDFLSAEGESGQSLTSSDVYSIAPFDNQVWIGTERGIHVWNQQDNTVTALNLPENQAWLTNGPVYCLLRDSENTIWAGTADNGLFRIQFKEEDNTFQIKRYAADQGENNLVSNNILCLHEASNGDLWVGTLDGISVIRDGNVRFSYKNDPEDSTSLADNEVYCILTGMNGTMWIGTFLGLNRFNPTDSTFIQYDNLLSDGGSINSIYSLYSDSAGMLWIGTDNSGLIQFDPEKETVVRQYTRESNLPDNVIYGILEDQEGSLWLSSNNGLIKALRQGTSGNLTFLHFNTDNWLRTDAFNIGAYARGSDGTLYFGGLKGVTHFHPDNVKGNNYVPPVYITDFQLFFEPVVISSDNSTPLSQHISETSELRLSHDQNVLRFGFAALNFIEPQNNTYAFWMENLEEEWNYVGNLREAQYMYLPPGEYVFHVKAANNDGIWNETGQSIAITIVPPFTQTVWFYLLLIGVVAIGVIWIFNYRTKSLRAARARLEKQVQIRTSELRDTNKNLEDEIRERQKVQDALAKSEARFRQLIETMNEGFSVQDREDKITYVNPRLCEMFGYTQEEVLGRYPIDFVDDSKPEYRERFNQEREASAENGRFFSYEMNWKRKDGTVFNAMVSPKPIFDAEGKFTGSVAVITDITDLKNAEKLLISKNEDLNEALDDLKKTQAQLIDSEKMASLGQLTAGVAHEINNPINFVSGNVQPLRRDIKDILDVLEKYDAVIEDLKLGKSFEEVEAMKQEIDFDFVLSEIDNLLNGIGEGASRTAEIVRGLRNFSRMDEHELKMANINEGLESTLLILHNKIKDRITIEKDFGEFPDVMCYPGQMNQVFMNLLNNAQEAIDAEGTITIRTWKEHNYVKISIQDTGRGIPSKSKKKIFDPFFTTKDVGKGTGLGLSISFGIVEKHNGSIDVTSEPGKGTEFIVSIPDNLS